MSNVPRPVFAAALKILCAVVESVSGYVTDEVGSVVQLAAPTKGPAVTIIAGSVLPLEVSVGELACTFQPAVFCPPVYATRVTIANVVVWSSPFSVTPGAVTGLAVWTVKVKVGAA